MECLTAVARRISRANAVTNSSCRTLKYRGWGLGHTVRQYYPPRPHATLCDLTAVCGRAFRKDEPCSERLPLIKGL
jgi:hypothetical protein